MIVYGDRERNDIGGVSFVRQGMAGTGEEATCPNCGSTSVSVERKGYDAEAGAAGCCACGAPGLLCGAAESDKLYGVCANCTHQWTIGKVGEHEDNQECSLPGVLLGNPGRGWLGCHGIPDRCLQFRGEPMPLCARCLGVYAGIAVVAPFLLAGSFPLSTPLVIASLLFMFVCFLDWSLQHWWGVMSTNPRRLVTGLLGGVGSASFALFLVGFLLFQLDPLSLLQGIG